jgi:hypothetical protein
LSCSSQRSPVALTVSPKRDRPAVTELPSPLAELVPAIVGRTGLHAIEQRVAGECMRKRRRCSIRRVDAQQRRHLARMRN